MKIRSWKDLNKLTKSWKNPFRGAGSILEIQPTDDEEPRLYHTDDTYTYHTDDKGSRLYHPARTDADALRGDWIRVGNDLKRALDRVADDAKVK